ncbi:hypothetical protein Ocin01_00125 [Orchesella cincta]|uniref:Uncharacterized protein n=1 Tax=Orchesella cincta TaxID=48709 RepID=A0A1D2NNK0_ORCCI|nr:hypothetical protein Ocin01_00125 [Orchesella cincta]
MSLILSTIMGGQRLAATSTTPAMELSLNSNVTQAFLDDLFIMTEQLQELERQHRAYTTTLERAAQELTRLYDALQSAQQEHMETMERNRELHAAFESTIQEATSLKATIEENRKEGPSN